MKDIEAMGVPCVAIRDMYAKLEYYYDAIALIRKLEQCKVKEQFNEYHSYQILVQPHITKNSDNVFNKLEFTSLSYKEALSHVPCAVQGWCTSFIILGGIKGLLSSCFLSLNCHFCLYTLLKQQEIHPLYTRSRKNIKKQMSTCWPSQ